MAVESVGATAPGEIADVRSGELHIQGLRTRVLEAGPEAGGEAVVFVHGSPGSADDWDRLLPEVGTFARAVAFDLPGFGGADKPKDWSGYTSGGWATFIAGATSRLGIGRVHLVLNDIGGEGGLAWAAAHPDSFASATMIDTGVPIGYRWHAIAKLHRAALLGAVAARGGKLGLRTALRLYEPRLPRQVVDRWQRESFPSADVVVLEGSGHYPHLDDPGAVAEVVLPFLRRQLKTPASGPEGR